MPPVSIILRDRLKYALTNKECLQICMERCVKVDGKVRTDQNYPAGFMDVIELDKSGDRFRLLFDTKGRYVLHRIQKDESAYKLCRITKVYVSANKIPVAVTHDGRTLRYPDPDIKVNDTVKVDIATAHALRNTRAPSRLSLSRMPKKHLRYQIAKRVHYQVGNHPQVTLPKGRGIKKTILQERAEAEARGDL
ncbi:ribosomal eS4-like protein [Fragilaria crotonensis]|nr:ribosomal eS4-like protein [Fragilaria crotonensis]